MSRRDRLRSAPRRVPGPVGGAHRSRLIATRRSGSSTTTRATRGSRGADQRLGLARGADPGRDRRHRGAPRTGPGAASRPSTATTTCSRATTGTRPPDATGSTTSAWTRRCCSRTTGCSGSASSPARADRDAREHAGLEPVVRDGRRRGRRAGCIPSRTSRCAIPTGWSRSSRTLAAGGVRLAMIAPAIVDGKPLSHPDLDRVWAAFVEHGDHAGVPRRRPDPAVRRRLVHRRRRRVRPGARLGLPLHRGRARVHRPHRQRRASSAIPTCGSASSSCPRSGCRCT